MRLVDDLKNKYLERKRDFIAFSVSNYEEFILPYVIFKPNDPSRFEEKVIGENEVEENDPFQMKGCDLLEAAEHDQKIFLRGRSGVGKTELLKWFCHVWASESGEQGYVVVWIELHKALRACADLEKKITANDMIQQYWKTEYGWDIDIQEIEVLFKTVKGALLMIDGLSEGEFVAKKSPRLGDLLKDIVNGACGYGEHVRFMMSGRRSEGLSPVIWKEYEVVGFDLSSKLRFARFFSSHTNHSFQSLMQLLQTNNSIRWMSDTPLQLMLMCFLHLRNVSVADIDTVPKLYVAAVECIVEAKLDHSQVRQTSLTQDFNTVMRELGKLALHNEMNLDEQLRKRVSCLVNEHGDWFHESIRDTFRGRSMVKADEVTAFKRQGFFEWLKNCGSCCSCCKKQKNAVQSTTDNSKDSDVWQHACDALALLKGCSSLTWIVGLDYAKEDGGRIKQKVISMMGGFLMSCRDVGNNGILRSKEYELAARQFLRQEVDDERFAYALKVFADCCRLRGLQEDAKMYYERSLELLKKLNLDDMLMCSDVLIGMALVEENPEKRLEMLIESMDIRKKEHADYSSNMHNIAITRFEQEEKRIEMFDECLQYKMKMYGEAHPCYARTLDAQGTLLSDFGDLDDALKCFEASQQIYGTTFKFHRSSLLNIANIYAKFGKFDQALEMYEQCKDKSHPSYVRVLGKIATVLYKKGDSNSALEVLDEQYTLQRRSLAEDDTGNHLFGLS